MSSEIAVEHDVSLAPLTTLRVGGVARRFVEAGSKPQLIRAVAEADSAGGDVLILAGGSNVVIADAGFAGTCVRVATRGIEIARDPRSSSPEVLVTVAAGERWDRLVAQLVSDGISGLETLSGIPGSVGATPIQNVGAYGTEVSQYIEWVDAYDRRSGKSVRLANADCGFSYRGSVFKADPDRWVVLSVTYRLVERFESVPIQYSELADSLSVAVGETVSAVEVRRTVLSVRRRKGMVLDIDDHDTWSVGSFFTNPIVDKVVADRLPPEAPTWQQLDGRVKVSAAWLIGQAGFARGWSLPDAPNASLSQKHALAITNRGGATAGDILRTGRAVSRGVMETFGIELVPEPRIVG